MNRPELYHKTVDILVQAYFNDTLEHGNCYACAVGNIIAANCGYSFVSEGYSKDSLIHTGCGTLYWNKNNSFEINPVQYMNCASDVIPFNHINDLFTHIDSTGYSFKELSEIEYSFEKNYSGEDTDEVMFEGLRNVIDCLDKIHKNTDSTITNISKNRFAKANK